MGSPPPGVGSRVGLMHAQQRGGGAASGFNIAWHAKTEMQRLRSPASFKRPDGPTAGFRDTKHEETQNARDRTAAKLLSSLRLMSSELWITSY